MAIVTTDSQNYTNIANAIRSNNFTNETYLPSEMANAISMTKSLPLDTNLREEEWVRPNTWPNLDLIDLTNFNGVYLTYDLSKTPSYGWIGIYVTTSSGNYTIERGHLENNTFIADYSKSQATKTYFRQNLDSTNGTIQLWRIYSPSANITRIVFTTNSGTNAQNKVLNLQPCVERYGRLPGLTSINSTNPPTSTTYSAGGWGTVWLEHDKIYDVTQLTTMAYAWKQCYNLRKIELPGWDISKCTTIVSAWEDCRSLKELDLSGWNTTALTTIASAWSGCYSLQSLDIHDWNVKKVTSMTYTWNSCYSLTSLDLSEWETDALTNLSYTWNCCTSLVNLKIDTWNTSKVTTLTYTWNDCTSLVELDLNDWDVQKVTTMAYAWHCCYNLRRLYIANWEPVLTTTMAYAWSWCCNLPELNINNWEPAVLQNLSYTWEYCLSLRSLDLDNWGLTQINTLTYAWRTCISLVELKINGWRPTVAINLSYTFISCWSLESIDISDWGNDITVTTLEYFTNGALNLQSADFSSIKHNTQSGNVFRYAMLSMPKLKYLNMDGLDMPSVTGTAGYPNLPSLVDFYPPIVYVNFSLAAAVRLNHDSLVRVINSLPTTSATRTCTLGQNNKLKLTAEEIAVGTGKGWTIA